MVAYANLLGPALIQFCDANGAPYANGKLYTKVPATDTLKTTWQDIAETTANANPVILDSAGRAQIWGDGLYRQQLYDSLGNLVWDQNALALSIAYISGLLANFVGDGGSGGAAGQVPAPPAGSAAQGWYLKANGNWAPLTVVIPAAPTASQAGFLGAPQNTVLHSVTSYQLQMSDLGGNIYSDNGSATTLTIPADATVNWPNGVKSIVTVDNATGAGNMSIVPAAGVSLLGPGVFASSGTRTLAGNGAAVISRIGPNYWTIIGSGLS